MGYKDSDFAWVIKNDVRALVNAIESIAESTSDARTGNLLRGTLREFSFVRKHGGLNDNDGDEKPQ